MSSHDPAPCEECIDWRIEQTHLMAGTMGTVIRNILTDLGIDPTDEEVGRTVARRLREADPTT